MLGPTATFRDGQREAIEAVAQDGRRALVVQRTGWGKCLVYWIATRVRRDTGHGPTLIISRLLALMRNQIAMAADGCRPWYSMVTVAGREPDAHPEGWLVPDQMAGDAISVDDLLALASIRERQVAVSIDTLGILRGRLSPRAHALVIEWAALHADELRADWELARSGLPLKPIPPLR